MTEEDFIVIEDFDTPKKKKPHGFESLGSEPEERSRENRTNNHFLFTNIFSAAALLVFLGLLILQVDVPEYFIGMIGAVLGYYLSKKPFE